MNRNLLAVMLTLLAAFLLSCSKGNDDDHTTAPKRTPTTIPPTPIRSLTRNSDWSPVIEEIDGVEMVLVPPGCFIMGNEQGRRDESPAHPVCFDYAFWLDRYEVTTAQYGSTGNGQRPNQPRENILWTEARDFCASRGGRLPTEAEWEYAARGPDNLIYPWGNTMIDENLVYDRTLMNETADVGSRANGVSWVGAYDMAGNVWEWVSSIHRPYPYDANDGREDMSDTTSQRVYRGGIRSYIDFAAAVTTRFKFPPDRRDWFVGFRCARSIEE
ncbi:MAG: formylglycine-generating enzyme family protein [Anaerolineae bacterium]|nr:formylglycine-generating enzyme family protein [Anaerolineae bacterium]